MTKKQNLTKSERRIHSANIERLKSAGLTVGVDNKILPDTPRLRIEQSEISTIYAGTREGIALELCSRFTAFKPWTTSRYSITIAGCDAHIFLAEAPKGHPFYDVFGWLEEPREAVLNHRILSGRPLPTDRCLDGILVAQSFGSLPRRLDTGMPLSVRLLFRDHLGNASTAEIRAILTWQEQSEARAQQRPNRATASSQLTTGSSPGQVAG